MSRVLRRLEKLEARLTDRSHLTPHSQEWFDYWRERLDRCFVDGDDNAIPHGSVRTEKSPTQGRPDGKKMKPKKSTVSQSPMDSSIF